jgi:hypothetical protein
MNEQQLSDSVRRHEILVRLELARDFDHMSSSLWPCINDDQLRYALLIRHDDSYFNWISLKAYQMIKLVKSRENMTGFAKKKLG